MLIRLQRYVLKDLLVVFLLAATVVSALITLGLSLRLIGEGLMPAQLRNIIIYIIPFTFPFAVPSALLIAAVMVFGRLSGDNELLAIRSSGISLWRIIWPVLGLGLILTLTSIYLNNDVLPTCHRQLEKKQQKFIGPYLERLGTARERVELPPYVIHIGGLDPTDHSRWQWVVAAKYARNTLSQVIMARYGRANYYPDTDRAILTLTDGWILHPFSGGENQIRFPEDIEYTIDLGYNNRTDPYPDDPEAIPSDERSMLFRQLIRHRKSLRAKVASMDTIADPRAVRRELQREHAELNLKIRQIYGEHRILRGQINSIEDQERIITARVEALESRVKHLGEELQSRREMLRHLESRIMDIRSSLITAPEDSERANELRQSLRDQELRRDEFIAMRENIERDIALGQEQIKQFNSHITSGHDQINEASQKVSAIEEEVAGLVQKSEALESRIYEAQTQSKLRQANIEVHFRLAQALACLVFALIGIPIGILMRRGGIIAAFGISFAVVLFLYFPVYSFGKQLAETGQLSANIALWLPNAICGFIGVILLWLSLRR